MLSIRSPAIEIKDPALYYLGVGSLLIRSGLNNLKRNKEVKLSQGLERLEKQRCQKEKEQKWKKAQEQLTQL